MLWWISFLLAPKLTLNKTYDFNSQTAACVTQKWKYADINAQKKSNLSHLLLHSRSNPNILTTNKSTFQFIKSVNWIQVAVPRQALYCVPNCILWPWWMGCQLRKTGWFQLKTLSSAPQVREKTRQDSSTSCERLHWPHFWPYTDLLQVSYNALRVFHDP